MTAPEKRLKSTKFDMRWSIDDLALIREAAKIKRLDPSAFIRQLAVAGAEAVVLEQQRFVLTAEQWVAVNAAFDAPAKVLPKLVNVLTEPDQWDVED